jgi:hypothetical protein
MSRLRTSLLAVATFVTLIPASASWASGNGPVYRDKGARGGIPPYVVAESRFGNGTVVGPVRPYRFGYQVRMPGGTWIDCRRSCSETLRVETIDFWENRKGAGRDAIDNECGIFGCLTLRRDF